MSEAAYPIPVNVSKDAIEKLSVAGDITFHTSFVEDVRPTQEFRDAVQEVLEFRRNNPQTRVPLTEAIDSYLARRDIRR
jgi:hypothetical protein